MYCGHYPSLFVHFSLVYNVRTKIFAPGTVERKKGVIWKYKQKYTEMINSAATPFSSSYKS